MLKHWPQQWLQLMNTKEALFLLYFFFHVSNKKKKKKSLIRKGKFYLICSAYWETLSISFLLGEVYLLHLT